MNHLIKRNNKIVKVHNNIIKPNPTFSVTTIGTQTWMAKNLDISDGKSGIYFVENVSANGLNMGRQYYYTYEAAVRIANNIEGWHLPTQAEFQTLKDYVGWRNIAKLKYTAGWDNNGNGTNELGFDAIPTGYLLTYNLYRNGESLYLRMSDNINGEVIITYSNGFTITSFPDMGSNYLSVRLVKD